MGESDNITTFLANTLFVGLLLLGLTSFYILTANNEGRGEIFDGFPEVQSLNLQSGQQFTDGGLLETANINSNLSADYNPEIAISAADQSGNAIVIGLQDIITETWTVLASLIKLIFGNVVGLIISTLVIAITGYLVVDLFIKKIRQG